MFWTLSDTLKKYKWLQAVLGLFPVFFVTLYVLMYCIDLMNVLAVLEHNDKYATEALNDGVLRPVSDYSDGVIRISGSDSATIDVSFGDSLFDVYIMDLNWYKYVLKDDILTCDSIDYINGVAKQGDEFIININGDKSLRLKTGDKLCTVMLSDSGSFIVDFGSYKYETDELTNVGVLLKTSDSYRLLVTSDYSIIRDNIQINFCRVLPTSEVYYDITNLGFIVNTTDSFAENIVVSSSLALVIFTLLVYEVVLLVIRCKVSDLSILGSTAMGLANCLIVLVVFFCYIVTNLVI